MAKRNTSVGATLRNDIHALLTELPWWTGPFIAGLAYVLFRFAIPACLNLFLEPADRSIDQAVYSGFAKVFHPKHLGYWAAGLVLFVWATGLMRKWRRRRLFDNANDPTYLRDISRRDFENMVGEYYQRRGFSVEQQDYATPVAGIDLILRKDGRTTLVQCIHWKTHKVSARSVYDLSALMSVENAAKGILLTSGRCTNEARDFAHQNNIELIEGHQLADLVHAMRNVKKREESSKSSSPNNPR